MKAATISLLVAVAMVAEAVAQVEPESATASAVTPDADAATLQVLCRKGTPGCHC